MKIGIDARIITKSITGAGRVVSSLLAELQNYTEHEFVVFHIGTFLPPPGRLPNVSYVLLDIPVSSFRNLFAAGRAIRGYHLDVLYYPFVDVPVGVGTPTVAVVYDLFYMEDRSYFSQGGRIRYLLVKFLTWWRLLAATSLIAISETTATQIRRLPLARNKNIFKVDLCLYSTAFKESGETALHPELASNRYFLYVGNNRRHKNLRTLIKAFSDAIPALPYDIRLVLCGSVDQRYEDPMNWVKEFGVEKRVLHLGPVSDTELEQLYKNCMCVAVPSLYEGFGLPALEGASYKKAVISSTVSALREVLGDTALYCDPQDVAAWARAMAELAGNEEKRSAIAEACYERSKTFSGERFGRETIAALVKTAQGL